MLGNQGVSAHFSCLFLAANGLIMIKYKPFLKTCTTVPNLHNVLSPHAIRRRWLSFLLILPQDSWAENHWLTHQKGAYQFRYFLPQCVYQILLLSAHACMNFYGNEPPCVYHHHAFLMCKPVKPPIPWPFLDKISTSFVKCRDFNLGHFVIQIRTGQCISSCSRFTQIHHIEMWKI